MLFLLDKMPVALADNTGRLFEFARWAAEGIFRAGESITHRTSAFGEDIFRK